MSRRWGMRTAATVGAVAIAFAALPTAPASAHPAGPPTATDYRTRITAVRPPVPGLRLRVVQNGTRMRLVNDTGHEVRVLGYAGEPYLRIRPDGAWANTRSPATWRNETIQGQGSAPRDARAGTEAPPRWRKVGDRPEVVWHDHRTHWMGDRPPPAVAAAPDEARRIGDWQIDLVVGGRPVAASGTLDYLPPPRPAVWWTGSLALAAAVAALGLARQRPGGGAATPGLLRGSGLTLPDLGRVRRKPGRRRRADAEPARDLRGRGPRSAAMGLSAALVAAALAELVASAGGAIDAGASGVGLIGTMVRSEPYGVATALAALAAAVFALRRGPAGPFALALAGACLCVLGGLASAATVFAHAQAPVPWAGEIARLCAVLTVGLTAGVSAGGWLLLRAQRLPDSPGGASAQH